MAPAREARADGSRPGPGRPSSGARERLLEAALEVLKEDGYAGLTTAKVAARAGQNKALIGYHFGSKQGLVAAVGGELAESVTAELLGAIEATGGVDGVVRGALDGLWRLMDEDARLARLYFDLAAVSVVEREVRETMRAMRDRWRRVLGELLASAGGPAPGPAAEAASVYVIATLEGLALERLERGETAALTRARGLFERSASAALRQT